ncbi:MAG: hypothetical protein HRU17_11375 [Polyangiaceae bacterium]|nr:hypothetical protein [Polyangiaceae bacterium]
MPSCYFLTVCNGSSVDQQSNNVTLFNLVEQINVPPGAPPPPKGLIPLEIHSYWSLSASETTQDFEVRYILVAETGIETSSEVYRHRCKTHRYRTRCLGLPMPPVPGTYELRVEWRGIPEDPWSREQSVWPVIIAEVEPKPKITH